MCVKLHPDDDGHLVSWRRRMGSVAVSPLLHSTGHCEAKQSRTKRSKLLQAALFAALITSNLALAAAPRLTDLQYVGSHNSYHTGFAASEATLLKQLNPALFAALDYRHPPLTQQLDDGVRQLELDVFADARGGRYAHPAIDAQIAKAGLPPAPASAPAGVMDKPGFKVMHVQDVDQRSNCQPLIACLQQVRSWSRQHPGHVPIFILLETKQAPVELGFPSVQPEPFDAGTMDALDAELRSVFRPGEYVSPDQVRGNAGTLNAAGIRLIAPRAMVRPASARPLNPFAAAFRSSVAIPFAIWPTLWAAFSIPLPMALKAFLMALIVSDS